MHDFSEIDNRTLFVVLRCLSPNVSVFLRKLKRRAIFVVQKAGDIILIFLAMMLQNTLYVHHFGDSSASIVDQNQESFCFVFFFLNKHFTWCHRTVVSTIIEKGRVSRPLIGITFLESARASTVGIQKGVLVLDVKENTSAASSGLRPTTPTQVRNKEEPIA